MGRYRDAARLAAELTNKELGARLAALAPISSDRLQEILPAKRDKEAFAGLMKVIEEETKLDTQLAFLRDNLATAGKAALMALRVFL